MPRLPVGWPCFYWDECQLQSTLIIYFAGVCVQIESGGGGGGGGGFKGERVETGRGRIGRWGGGRGGGGGGEGGEGGAGCLRLR